MIGKTFARIALLSTQCWLLNIVAAKPVSNSGCRYQLLETRPIGHCPDNRPLTTNEEWSVDLFAPPTGEPQPISSPAQIGMFQSTSCGVYIYDVPVNLKCFTSPTTAISQNTVTPFTDDMYIRSFLRWGALCPVYFLWLSGSPFLYPSS
ncbi:unnamed protein product [Somion occarium]|uniref:Uncharacterized protein n=1 Tax=Somion occarium TaxID=3059160 RepID=A0ABP1DWL3_9APHY